MSFCETISNEQPREASLSKLINKHKPHYINMYKSIVLAFVLLNVAGAFAQNLGSIASIASNVDPSSVSAATNGQVSCTGSGCTVASTAQQNAANGINSNQGSIAAGVAAGQAVASSQGVTIPAEVNGALSAASGRNVTADDINAAIAAANAAAANANVDVSSDNGKVTATATSGSARLDLPLLAFVGFPAVAALFATRD
eukprot:GILK01014563.1.p1 GENE.GILK01014563.1~~GILK01014563.1.p1  ORF type:complete len:200 (+),score=44.76 GILK01014563.1:141-740(+)